MLQFVPSGQPVEMQPHIENLISETNSLGLRTSTAPVLFPNEKEPSYVTFSGFPANPFLVVIRITPFDALEPYIAVAEASLRTVE